MRGRRDPLNLSMGWRRVQTNQGGDVPGGQVLEADTA
jgi:hypothetical protein